jgi:hypothetical protein
MNKWVQIFILTMVIITIGFFQERLKVNINFIIDKSTEIPGFFSLTSEKKIEAMEPLKKQGNFDYYYSHGNIPLLYSIDLKQLTILKWIVTASSVVIHLLINILLLRLFQSPKFQFQLLYIISTLIFLTALLSQLLGTLLNLNQEFYPISRGLMGILQSPILAIIFLLATNYFANGKHKQLEQ